MPLTICALPASTDAWGVSFHMLSAAGGTVHCRITRAALEKLGGRQHQLSGFEQAILFDHWHKEIERLASQKYDVGRVENGLLLIEPEDLVDRFR
jgi:hypothetical protein